MIHFTFNCQNQQRHVAKQHGPTDVRMIVFSCSFQLEESGNLRMRTNLRVFDFVAKITSSAIGFKGFLICVILREI